MIIGRCLRGEVLRYQIFIFSNLDREASIIKGYIGVERAKKIRVVIAGVGKDKTGFRPVYLTPNARFPEFFVLTIAIV